MIKVMNFFEYFYTNITSNLAVELFLTYIKWFSVKLIVLLPEVVIDLYIVTTVSWLFINAFTSLCDTLPSDATKNK